MTQVVTIEKNVLDDIFSQLTNLKKEVALLKQKVLTKKPKEGSEEWWDIETEKALKEAREGKVERFDSMEAFIADLQS